MADSKTFGHNFGIQTPQKYIGHDTNVRCSPRFTDQDVNVRFSPKIGSAVNKLKMSSQKTYPGSARKPQGRRSFRTPIQTLPLGLENEKSKGAASKSFVVVEDMDDIITPKSNIDAFLAVAHTEARASKTPLDVLARSSVTRSSKRQNQPHRVASQRSSTSVIDELTPSSKVTPRTNILNFLQNDLKVQTPSVGTEGKSKEPPVKTRASTAAAHKKWGQEVSLSPSYLNHTSEDEEESSSTSVKSLRRSRRSFHVLASRASALPSTADNGRFNQPSTKAPVSTVKQRTRGQEVTLSPMYLNQTSEGESPHISMKSLRRTRHSFHIPVSQAVALQSTVSGKIQSTAKSDVSENANEEDGSPTFSAKELHAFINPGDMHSNTADKTTHLAEATSAVASDINDVEENTLSTHNINNEPENSQDFVENIDINKSTAYDKIQSNRLAGTRVDAVSRVSRLEETVVGWDMGRDVNKSGYNRSNAQDGTIQDVHVTQFAHHPGDMLATDVDKSSTEDRNGTRRQEVEEIGNDNQVSMRKDKSFWSNRTSFTNKQGEMFFSMSPKNMSKSPQLAPLPNVSVYDLSDTSNSSGSIQLAKQRNSTFNQKKTLSQMKLPSSKGRHSATESSVKKSKLSYSEWKSLQTGGSVAGQSFLHLKPQLSSTPVDRTKSIFHSTRINNSTTANMSHEQAPFMADTASNISPIQLDGRGQRQAGLMARQEVMDANADQGNDGGDAVLAHSARQAEADVESFSDESLGLSPLATPYVDMGKKTQGLSFTGQKAVQSRITDKGASGSAQKRKTDQAKVSRQPRKRTKSSQLTALPRSSVKFFAERQSTMKMSKDAVEEIETASEQFWENTFKALEAIALEAGRNIINEQDAILLMKTQGLVSNTEELHDRIREFLPMELRSELIPMAKP